MDICFCIEELGEAVEGGFPVGEAVEGRGADGGVGGEAW